MEKEEKQYENFEDFERAAKEETFELLEELRVNVDKMLKAMTEDAHYLGMKPSFDNHGIAYNNKIVELANEFKNSGRSFYANIYRIETPEGTVEKFGESFVGHAFLYYLSTLSDQITELMLQYQQLTVDTLNETSFFGKVRYVFKIANNQCALDSEEQAVFYEIERKAKDILNQIIHFSIKDKGFEAIVSLIDYCNEDDVEDALKYEVFPILTILGYTDIADRLKDKYKEKLAAKKYLDEYRAILNRVKQEAPEIQKKWPELCQKKLNIVDEIDQSLFPLYGVADVTDSSIEDIYLTLMAICNLPSDTEENFMDKLNQLDELQAEIYKVLSLADKKQDGEKQMKK